MHFAYPPRKSSNPPPFRPRSSRFSLLRRSRLKTVGVALLAIVGLLWFLAGRGEQTGYREHVPSGNPPVVVLTVVDPTSYTKEYIQTIRDNREYYAKKHGYSAMVVKAYDYDTRGAPQSWTKIIAMRHALTLYPDCKFVWFLDQNAYIMDHTKSIENQVADSKRLESLMVKDYPVVPESIIKTFTHLKGEDANLIISQDVDGLVSDSVIIRNGDWAKYFVETWMDPLYRSYNFQKAERHALEHIVQWHPTILSKLALVPQRTLASYTRNKMGAVFQGGDFVIMMAGCTASGPANCEQESQYYTSKLQAIYGES